MKGQPTQLEGPAVRRLPLLWYRKAAIHDELSRLLASEQMFLRPAGYLLRGCNQPVALLQASMLERPLSVRIAYLHDELRR